MDVIEPYTPYSDCLMWRIHTAYYRQRGVAVWTRKEIPSIATSNLAHARHVADLLIARDVDDETVVVLEVGGGSGEFAASFLRALAERAPALLARTRYMLSDFAAETLAAAVELPDVATWVASGHLVTTTYDLAHPEEITLPGRPALVVANYVCCALPMRPVAKQDGAWSEPWVETRAELNGQSAEAFVAALLDDATVDDRQAIISPTLTWRPIDLDAALGDDMASVVRLASDDYETARVLLPARFFAFMRALAPRLARGGMFVVSDYGYVERARFDAPHAPDHLTEQFANSLGQEVQFPLFDVLGDVLGWAVAQTSDPLDEVHVAVVGPTGLAPAVRDALAQRTWGRTESGHLLDFREAARALMKDGDKARALRFWLRCAAIDPRWPEAREQIAELAHALDMIDLAEEHLLAGLALAPDAAPWEHGLGHVAAARGDAISARAHWMQAFVQEPRAATAVELARLSLERDDLGGAFRWLERALTIEPEDAAAEALMREVRDRTWHAATSLYRDEGAFVELPVADDDRGDEGPHEEDDALSE